MSAPHRYSAPVSLLLALLFVTGCFATASVLSLGAETTAAASSFHTQPIKLLGRLTELAKLDSAGNLASADLPAEAMQLLSRTQRGDRLSDRELVDAFLIASGVNDDRRRNAYAKKLDEITAAARKAVAAAKSPAERGDLLLKHLHAGPMKAGYDADETRLSILLDGGRFNCVSATALYQLVARRLELPVQALGIPGEGMAGHAMTIFAGDDRRIDVETTNDDGFDFERKVNESGATVIGIKLDPAKGHEVSDVGLASLMAQNRASGSGKDKEPLAAIQAALVGIALDPQENAKANNFVAAVNEWAMRLGDANKYDDALAIMRFGMELMPAEDTLKNNSGILWNRYAVFEVKAGRGERAVELIAKATQQGLLNDSADGPAAPFIRVASDLSDEKQWSDAIAVIEQGLKAVQGDSTEKLRDWLVQVHAQWAEAERKDGKVDPAIDVLAAMWKKAGEARAARDAIEYFAQESLRQVEESGGPAAAAALLVRLRKEFPSVDSLNEAGEHCARRAIDKLLDGGKFDEAVAAVEQYKPLLSDGKARDELGGIVYDRRGRELMRKKKWADAVAAYRDGRAKFPTSELLANNAVVAWNGWAREAIDEDDLPEAIRIYERAIKDVGERGPLKRNLEICRRKLKR